MNFSIIIFCHNEAGNIQQVIESAFAFLYQHSTEFEVIIVDDGSTDETPGVIAPFLQTSKQLKYLKHQKNSGIGMALCTGYAAAEKEYVCAIPGDGQFNIKELLDVKPFDHLSFYSFYRPRTYYSLYRSFLTFANREFNALFLGIRLKDVNWIKVYRKEQLDFADSQLKSSIVESEICAKLIKAGARPIELPSVYQKRTSGVSKGGNWKTLRLVIRDVYDLFTVVHRFKKHF